MRDKPLKIPIPLRELQKCIATYAKHNSEEFCLVKLFLELYNIVNGNVTVEQAERLRGTLGDDSTRYVEIFKELQGFKIKTLLWRELVVHLMPYKSRTYFELGCFGERIDPRAIWGQLTRAEIESIVDVVKRRSVSNTKEYYNYLEHRVGYYLAWITFTTFNGYSPGCRFNIFDAEGHGAISIENRESPPDYSEIVAIDDRVERRVNFHDTLAFQRGLNTCTKEKLVSMAIQRAGQQLEAAFVARTMLHTEICFKYSENEVDIIAVGLEHAGPDAEEFKAGVDASTQTEWARGDTPETNRPSGADPQPRRLTRRGVPSKLRNNAIRFVRWISNHVNAENYGVWTRSSPDFKRRVREICDADGLFTRAGFN